MHKKYTYKCLIISLIYDGVQHTFKWVDTQVASHILNQKWWLLYAQEYEILHFDVEVFQLLFQKIYANIRCRIQRKYTRKYFIMYACVCMWCAYIALLYTNSFCLIVSYDEKNMYGLKNVHLKICINFIFSIQLKYIIHYTCRAHIYKYISWNPLCTLVKNSIKTQKLNHQTVELLADDSMLVVCAKWRK